MVLSNVAVWHTLEMTRNRFIESMLNRVGATSSPDTLGNPGVKILSFQERKASLKKTGGTGRL